MTKDLNLNITVHNRNKHLSKMVCIESEKLSYTMIAHSEDGVLGGIQHDYNNDIDRVLRTEFDKMALIAENINKIILENEAKHAKD